MPAAGGGREPAKHRCLRSGRSFLPLPLALDLSAIVEFLFGIARVVALLCSLGNDICG